MTAGVFIHGHRRFNAGKKNSFPISIAASFEPVKRENGFVFKTAEFRRARTLRNTVEYYVRNTAASRYENLMQIKIER